MGAVRNFLLDTALPSGTGGNEFGNWSGAHPATEPWLAAGRLEGECVGEAPEGVKTNKVRARGFASLGARSSSRGVSSPFAPRGRDQPAVSRLR